MSVNKEPVVSIVIPVFNLAGLIAETLNSVLSQTFTDFEVLVIDDGSSDDTLSVVESYIDKDSRIKLLENRHSKGVSGARNSGIDVAQGEWIAFLDGDDIWAIDSLEVRIKSLSLFPEVSFISADYAHFTIDINNIERSRAVSNVDWSLNFDGALKTKVPICLNEPVKYFLNSVLVHTGTIMVKSHIIQSLGGFDESLPSCEDDHLWLRVSASVDELVFVPKVVMFYRQREGSLTHSKKALHHYAPLAYQMLLRDPLFDLHKDKLRINIRHFIHQNSFFYRKKKNYKEAFSSAIHGVLWDPFSLVSWKNLITSCVLR